MAITPSTSRFRCQHGADRIGRLLHGIDPRRPQPEDPVAVAENPLALGRTAVCNGLHTYKGKKIKSID